MSETLSFAEKVLKAYGASNPEWGKLVDVCLEPFYGEIKRLKNERLNQTYGGEFTYRSGRIGMDSYDYNRVRTEFYEKGFVPAVKLVREIIPGADLSEAAKFVRDYFTGGK